MRISVLMSLYEKEKPEYFERSLKSIWEDQVRKLMKLSLWKMNREGLECWVNNNVKLVHLGGGTGGVRTKTLLATRPANRKGWVIYHGEGIWYREILIKTCIWLNSLIWIFGWDLMCLVGKKYAKLSLMANINVCRTIFNSESTKETFIRFYKK